MDYNHYDVKESPKSHYEYVTQQVSANLPTLKSEVFKATEQLHGWCSNEKASILIDLIVAFKPQVVVEIGVFGGKSLIPMAFALRYNKQGKIYGVDPWDNIASAEGMDGVNLDWWISVDHDQILEDLEQKIDAFALKPQIELIRSTSENCRLIENIQILHIDGNHSEKTSYLDVIKWVPLVKSGGLVIFDDITWGTTKLATEWLDAHCTKVAEYHGDNVWGIWIKP